VLNVAANAVPYDLTPLPVDRAAACELNGGARHNWLKAGDKASGKAPPAPGDQAGATYDSTLEVAC
jgi:hypothetical protein